MRGDVHGFLTGRGVQHQQNFRRLHEVAQPHEFLHERLVNLQTSGGVENNDVAIIGLGEVERFPRNFQKVRFAALKKIIVVVFLGLEKSKSSPQILKTSFSAA